MKKKKNHTAIMKEALLPLLLLLVGVSAAGSLRVMSYNIRSGVGMDDVFNLTRQALVIAAAQPDVVGLQEVDNFTQRHFVDEASTLAQLTGLHATFAKMRDFEGGEYGVALLTREKPLATRVFHYYNPSGGGGSSNCSGPPAADDYCQGALAVRLASVWVVCTHVGLYEMQLPEARELVDEFVPLLEAAQPRAAAVVVVGDFNSVPTSAAVRYVVAEGNFTDTWAQCGVGDGFTFDAAKPYERIDYIFRRPQSALACKEIFVPDTQASDHRPVVASFVF